MLILLDIDGVMVPATSWKAPEFLMDGFPVFSKKATVALQKIISESGADIILTTSHKSRYSIQQWNDIFDVRGISVNKIEVLPENTDHLSRKDEVMKWLDINSDNNFIIIDDDKSLNGLPTSFKDRLLLTSPLIGLTNDLADDAITILNRDKLIST